MAAIKIPLQKMLSALDAGDRDFYDNLSVEEKKVFSAYIAMRWGSCIQPGKDYSAELAEYYLISTNVNANKHLFSLNKHPKLQWLMISSITPGFGKMNHGFVKPKPKIKENQSTKKRKKKLEELFPLYGDDELELLAEINTMKEINEYIKDTGKSDG